MKLYAFTINGVPHAAMWDVENQLIHFAGETGTHGVIGLANGPIMAKRPIAALIKREVVDYLNFINAEEFDDGVIYGLDHE